MIYLISLIYIICPLLAIPLIIIGIATSNKTRIYLLVLLAIIFAILSYYIQPPETFDLYRYHVVMERYKYVDSVFDILKIADYELLFNMSLFLISKIGNYKLLSCIYTFLAYLIMFYVLNDYSKKIDLSNWKTFVLVLLFIFTFNYTNFASGLRNGIGIIIAIFAFYLEFIKDKKSLIYKLLYIIPCLFHKSLFIIIIFRLLIQFDYKKVKKAYLPLMIGIFISGNLLVNLASVIAQIPIFGSLGYRASVYVNSSENTFSNIFLYTIIVSIFYSIIYLYNKKKYKDNINNKLYELVDMLLIICIAMIPYRVMFVRFITFYNLISILIIADFVKNEKNKNNFWFAIFGMIILMCGGSVFQYLNITSLNFGTLFSDGIIKNIFSIFLI